MSNLKIVHISLILIGFFTFQKLPDLNKPLNAQNQGNNDVIASKVIVRSRGLVSFEKTND